MRGVVELPQCIDNPGVDELPWGDETPGVDTEKEGVLGEGRQIGENMEPPPPPEQPRRAEMAAATRK